MNNNEKLVNAFVTSLGIKEELVKDDLKYNSIPQWDSIAHMSLVSELESVFDVMLDTDEIIDMSSVAKTREILSSHDIEF
ncbi:acyl carrier protein [Shewanella xiamenensis]|uniref:acyl carrier protein n=1 Tax=Shewanella xiamenensis TaxID=332186 RepID=UPI0035BAD5F0